MEICSNSFPFSLVGMGGNDIVDGNQKYIKTLLWQIMLYHSTKQLNLNNNDDNGHTITNKEMIKWCNDTMIKYKNDLTENKDNNDDTNYILENNLIKSKISSFKDKSLSDSIFYLNLLSSINTKWVNYKLINKISKTEKNNKNNKNEYKKKCIQNATYCITIIRRLGVDLFITVDDLYRVEQRAVLSIIASIMNIHQKNKNKQQNK